MNVPVLARIPQLSRRVPVQSLVQIGNVGVGTKGVLEVTDVSTEFRVHDLQTSQCKQRMILGTTNKVVSISASAFMSEEVRERRMHQPYRFVWGLLVKQHRRQTSEDHLALTLLYASHNR
jgi:hypothetical protein